MFLLLVALPILFAFESFTGLEGLEWLVYADGVS